MLLFLICTTFVDRKQIKNRQKSCCVTEADTKQEKAKLKMTNRQLKIIDSLIDVLQRGIIFAS